MQDVTKKKMTTEDSEEERQRKAVLLAKYAEVSESEDDDRYPCFVES